MTRLKGLLVIALLLLGSCQPLFAANGMSEAKALFVPIACTSPEVFRAKIGTGYPVREHVVFTAAHVDCNAIFGPEAVTEVSGDGGRSWVEIDGRLQAKEYDLAALVVSKWSFRHVARFGEAKLGMAVVGYGVAYDETFTFGRVMKITKEWVIATNTGIGGMSGSALIDEKTGLVVGMVTQGRPTVAGPGIPTSWPSWAIPGEVLQTLANSFKMK